MKLQKYLSDIFFIIGLLFISVGIALLFGWEYSLLIIGLAFVALGALIAAGNNK